MRYYYDVIEIDNYVILNTLQNFHFQEYSIFAIWTKNMPNQILAKYLNQFNYDYIIYQS